MSLYIFEAENLGQCLRVIDCLKSLDKEICIQEKTDIGPFESNIRVKIQVEASFEQVLKTLSEAKNSKTPLDTIRPMQ